LSHAALILRCRDEKLSQPDFLEAVVQMMSDRKTVQAFAYFDADGSGEIDLAEMRTLIAMVCGREAEGLGRVCVLELHGLCGGSVWL
jgi:Ca2+-binding EF-hand superfamily protein